MFRVSNKGISLPLFLIVIAVSGSVEIYAYNDSYMIMSDNVM